jgi:hypothetical protein
MWGGTRTIKVAYFHKHIKNPHGSGGVHALVNACLMATPRVILPTGETAISDHSQCRGTRGLFLKNIFFGYGMTTKKGPSDNKSEGETVEERSSLT